MKVMKSPVTPRVYIQLNKIVHTSFSLRFMRTLIFRKWMVDVIP